MSVYVPTLNEPLSYSAIVDSTLLQDYPDAWENTYYFDPGRARRAADEGMAIYELVGRSFSGLPKRLEAFSNEVTRAVEAGTGQTIPLTSSVRKFSYLMGESPRLDKKKATDRIFRRCRPQRLGYTGAGPHV